jgi:hypothetical protein
MRITRADDCTTAVNQEIRFEADLWLDKSTVVDRRQEGTSEEALEKFVAAVGQSPK